MNSDRNKLNVDYSQNEGIFRLLFAREHTEYKEKMK